MKAQIQAALEEIRPFIQADGGDVEFVSYRNGRVTVRLTGTCVGCPAATVTLKQGIEEHLKKKLPEIQEVFNEIPYEEPAASAASAAPDAPAAPSEPNAPPRHSPFESSERAQTTSVTAGLRACHSRAKELLNELDKALEAIEQGRGGPEQERSLEGVGRFLKTEMAIHMHQEDEVLFPALIPFISWGSPMSVMAKEHRLLQEEFDAFEEALRTYRAQGSSGDLIRLGRRLAQHLRDDFFQEENVLFVEADESLTGSRAKALREAMERIAAAAARAAPSRS